MIEVIPPDNYIIFLKFSEQRWIDSLVNGNFSFSCVGKFIQQAQATGDTVQGDSFEGYFARLKKDDKRLTIMRSRLKDDLEESNDGNYVLLRTINEQIRKNAQKPRFRCSLWVVKNAINCDLRPNSFLFFDAPCAVFTICSFIVKKKKCLNCSDFLHLWIPVH